MPAAGVLLALAVLAGCTTTLEGQAASPAPSPEASADGSTGGAAALGDDPNPEGGATDSGGATTSATADPAALADPDRYAAALVAGTNRVRAAENLAPLTVSPCAADAALARADALVGAPDLQHAPLDSVLDACGPLTRAAENLSRAAASPDDVVEAWMGSPGHRQNLLSAEMTQIGVACVPDGDQMLCSQIFLGP